jgi:hypothetical protein
MARLLSVVGIIFSLTQVPEGMSIMTVPPMRCTNIWYAGAIDWTRIALAFVLFLFVLASGWVELDKVRKLRLVFRRAPDLRQLPERQASPPRSPRVVRRQGRSDVEL